jgi:alpha-galactosidase
MKRVVVSAVLLLPTCLWAQDLKNLAPTPPMGWNTWNTFGINIDEELVLGVAKVMKDNGMQAAGYRYIVLDDAWMAKTRDPNGNLVGDPHKFPHGMKYLGDTLHEMGFKFGLYNCAGNKTCAGWPGSKGHEEQDAKVYASFGADYLKYDWCDTNGVNAKEAYPKMRDALRATGRPIIFSMCEWGQNKPWEWAADVAQLWRTTGDIGAWYSGQRQWSSGWKTILDKQVGLEKYAGLNHWNDPDMLEVGNGELTLAESRAHFSLWCILAAPLMAGNDVRKMSDDIRNILTAREVIALDQDPLGKQGYRFKAEGGKEVWVKELSNGQWAVCVLNDTANPADITVNWKDLTFLTGTYKVRDLWQKKDAGTTSDAFTAPQVAAHDVVLLQLSPVK